MSKKLQPSGYQIIELDVSAQTSGTAFDPVTDDEKLLYSILDTMVNEGSNVYRKPILLKLITEDYTFMGYPVICNGYLSLTSGAVGSTVTEEIGTSGTQLVWTSSEE